MRGKRLYRSNAERKLAGVCGGVAEYFDVDPTFVRLLTIIVGGPTFPFSILSYLIAIWIVPRAPESARPSA